MRFVGLQRGGNKAVPAQHQHPLVAQFPQLGGGLLKAEGQRPGIVGVGGDDHIAAQGQPVLQQGGEGKKSFRNPR